MESLTRKKCFVTGAASGIGQAVARAAAAEGAEMLLTDLNEAMLSDTVKAIQAGGGTVLASRALDIADYEQVKAFCDDILMEHGNCDVIMNVAGIAIWGDITRLEHRHWQSVVAVNLMGPIHVLECLVPAMVDAGRGGHIVNVSSAAGLFALPWHAAYSASKFGLRGLSEVLRFDLKRHGIHVHLVCPGAVNTGLVNTLQIAGIDQEAPEVAAMRSRFQRHAVTPDAAAKKILKGIKRNRFVIYTSNDIRVAYWLKRKFAWPYEIVIAAMTRRIQTLADRQWRRTD